MKKHKSIIRALALSFCCILIFCSTACGKQNSETSLSSAQMLTLVCDSQGYAESLTVFVSPGDAFNAYIERYFDIQPEDLNDGAVVYMGGVRGDEIVIVHLKESSMVRAVEESMRTYIERRIEHFNGYVPEVVTMLRNAMIATRGNYVALLICEQPSEAEKAFFSAFDSELTSVAAMQEKIEPEPEEEIEEEPEEDIVINVEYDHDAILKAWETGNTQYLSEKNLFILESASDVINSHIREGMSDYEKELVLHDWIINWAAYDTSELERPESNNRDPDSSTPYGLFANQRVICKGYTYTFQLFMDMIGIECITVNGTAHVEEDEHAWNMIRLDGEWYCVDVTWDDPVSTNDIDDMYHHMFFNVTSQYMRDTQHNWDESSVPEATADKYRWRPAN